MGSERPCRDCVSTEQDMLPAGRNCRNFGWEGNLVSWRPAEASPTCHWLPSLATAWDGSVPAGWFFWGYFADWRDRLCRGATLCEEAELPVDTSPQKVDRSPQKKEEMDFFFEGSGPKIKPRNFRAFPSLESVGDSHRSCGIVCPQTWGAHPSTSQELEPVSVCPQTWGAHLAKNPPGEAARWVRKQVLLQFSPVCPT
jgi:hypothetical protein